MRHDVSDVISPSRRGERKRSDDYILYTICVQHFVGSLSDVSQPREAPPLVPINVCTVFESNNTSKSVSHYYPFGGPPEQFNRRLIAGAALRKMVQIN